MQELIERITQLEARLAIYENAFRTRDNKVVQPGDTVCVSSGFGWWSDADGVAHPDTTPWIGPVRVVAFLDDARDVSNCFADPGEYAKWAADQAAEVNQRRARI